MTQSGRWVKRTAKMEESWGRDAARRYLPVVLTRGQPCSGKHFAINKKSVFACMLWPTATPSQPPRSTSNWPRHFKRRRGVNETAPTVGCSYLTSGRWDSYIIHHQLNKQPKNPLPKPRQLAIRFFFSDYLKICSGSYDPSAFHTIPGFSLLYIPRWTRARGQPPWATRAG